LRAGDEKKSTLVPLVLLPNSEGMIVMKRFLLVLLLLTTSATAQTSPVETWRCWDYADRSETVLVTATVEAGRKEGSIAVAGVIHTTVYRVTGFDRRWDFGLENKSYQYSFVIEPNGGGKYFDFGVAKATPKQLMKCREVGAANALDTKEQAETQQRVTEDAAAEQAKVIDGYKQRIHAKIMRLVVLPPKIQGNPEVEFNVGLLPDGNPFDIKLKRSSGNAAYDSAIERAILKASPMPLPPDAAMFKYFRNFTLVFRAN
jgi:TonB family protein